MSAPTSLPARAPRPTAYVGAVRLLKSFTDTSIGLPSFADKAAKAPLNSLLITTTANAMQDTKGRNNDHATLSGCPQGGAASPVLSNVYLDRLDRFIERDILPAYNRGARRTPYRPYMRLWQQACRLERGGERKAGRMLRKQMKTMPSRDPADPGYRRRCARVAWPIAITRAIVCACSGCSSAAKR